MNIFHLNSIRDQAEHAAEQNMDPLQACPYPADSIPAFAWSEYYRERVESLNAEAACS